jgi:uncharacterized protein (DUF924 family)
MDASAIQLTNLEHVIEFWFGEETVTGEALTRKYAQWFTPDAAFDAAIKTRFAPLVAAAGHGDLQRFASSARGSLALILLLDQFPRNIHRGHAGAFAYDGAALRHCLEGLERGFDRQLSRIERVFFYLPLEHAEDLACQQRSVELFERMLNDADDTFVDIARRNLEFARDHRDLIARFGRFPHHNAALKRPSSDEEQAHLAAVNKSFGQG